MILLTTVWDLSLIFYEEDRALCIAEDHIRSIRLANVKLSHMSSYTVKRRGAGVDINQCNTPTLLIAVWRIVLCDVENDIEVHTQFQETVIQHHYNHLLILMDIFCVFISSVLPCASYAAMHTRLYSHLNLFLRCASLHRT